jgi:hypothetical protein
MSTNKKQSIKTNYLIELQPYDVSVNAVNALNAPIRPKQKQAYRYFFVQRQCPNICDVCKGCHNAGCDLCVIHE